MILRVVLNRDTAKKKKKKMYITRFKMCAKPGRPECF